MGIIFPKSGDQRKCNDVNSKGEGGGIPNTLVCLIDVLGKINVQVEKFLKNIKRADPNKQAVQGGFFFSQN